MGHPRWWTVCVLGLTTAAIGQAPASPSNGEPPAAQVKPAGEDQHPDPAKSLPAEAGPIAAQYRETAGKIVSTAMSGNDAYGKLVQVCDDIGPRFSGTLQLTYALKWAEDTFRKDGQENVRTEELVVPAWERGTESLRMMQPREMDMPLLGLGSSKGTGPEGITAPVVVVRDKEELEKIKDEVPGKIVVFNYPMRKYDPKGGTGYGDAVQYRSNGATWAAEHGAVACLVRSTTAHSLRTVHTGAQKYGEEAKRIPVASITIEDAELLHRFYQRQVSVVVHLVMDNITNMPRKSGNVMAELVGREKPDEIVVIGGHIDSWDVGQGAHDDAGGCVMAMEAINVLRKMGLRPRRTIRVVLWTNEENGLQGAKLYAQYHEGEMANHVAAIEADSGVFQPTGYSVECESADREAIAANQMRDVLSLLEPLGPMTVSRGHSGADLGPMKAKQVMLMGHGVDQARYFDYHHSAADTVDKVDPADLAKNVAAMAVVAYVLADMPDRVGERGGD
ncbi:MAG: M20/M25/M40 family metallo-hydrolase [Phycisphaerales bacterium]|nr:M20/M25/M40 family metallo-hydrolase [Phycisphaerales bacterium]